MNVRDSGLERIVYGREQLGSSGPDGWNLYKCMNGRQRKTKFSGLKKTSSMLAKVLLVIEKRAKL